MAIWRSASEESHDFLSGECLQQVEPYVHAYIESESFETFTYLLNDRCVAFISLSDSEILFLYVAPEWQRQDIGSELLNFVKSRVDSLTLKVHTKNAKAIGFYEKHGFQADGTVTADSCNELQLTMSWHL